MCPIELNQVIYFIGSEKDCIFADLEFSYKQLTT